jgi:predicted helicase
LYDSYIRAFRWAADRIKDEGIVCFVTNGGWIDGNTMDGFRKTLQDEFSDVYVFNLRGNLERKASFAKKRPVRYSMLVQERRSRSPCW